MQGLDFHTHSEYEIFLFHGGNCRFLVGNQIYYLHPGDLLMMDGMTVHRAYVFGNEENYERSVIHFDAKWIEPLLADLQIDDLLKFFTENRNGLIRTFEKEDLVSIENMFLAMKKLDALDSSYKNEAKRKLALVQILLKIDSATVRVMDKAQNYEDERTKIAEEISSYVFEHYRESFTIEDVASTLNLSKSYLSHLFKEMTGFTVMEYVMACRLTQVKYLLEMEPEKSIKEIAMESGFESASHFSRYFREREGMTARQYRRQRLEIYEKMNE